MRFKMIAAATMAVAFAVLTPTLASAAPQDFEIQNSTGYDIKSIFISPTASNDWGDDVMGQDELAADATVPIHFPQGRGETCNWDLKVTYEDDSTAEWTNFDLCTISSIDISYNKDSGKTWATWK
jgi:hypothetical protein